MNTNQLRSICRQITRKTGLSCRIDRSIRVHSPDAHEVIEWRFWIHSDREVYGEHLLAPTLSELLPQVHALVRELNKEAEETNKTAL